MNRNLLKEQSDLGWKQSLTNSDVLNIDLEVRSILSKNHMLKLPYRVLFNSELKAYKLLIEKFNNYDLEMALKELIQSLYKKNKYKIMLETF